MHTMRMDAIDCRRGDKVWTYFSREWTVHTITARRAQDHVSETGVQFQVTPPVKGSNGADAWIDANWFERVKP